MLYLPFIGRLYIQQYIALLGSFVFLFLESFVRVITLALPAPIIRVCYRLSRRAFNSLSSPQGRQSRGKDKAIVDSIAGASDFVELCALFGYYAEEHIVQTKDGYLLGLHRLGWRHGEEERRVNGGKDSVQKKVVYLHHGLMMTSEVWVCMTEEQRCLPFQLVERGYDVWLGNNRGNKYSKKSVKRSPADTKFWDFSMDQFAFHDIPDSINYILQATAQPSLSYIGFSQGTAQAFATLSIHPLLNEKVNIFIALAPAMSPSGLTSGIVDSLVKASPDVLFLAFGRRALLTSATMWQAILYQPIFVRLIDWSLSFLFGWRCRNISPHQKLAAYPHLYSFTSTKSVVHWFQIIRTGTFQMYDDEVQSPFGVTNGSQYYKVAKYPTRNIKTPIVLVYGGSDSLVSIDVMQNELPKHTVAKEVPHYEHLDFLWANDVHEEVFPYVFDALYAVHHSENEAGARGSVNAAMMRLDTVGNKRGLLTAGSDDERLPSSDGIPHKAPETPHFGTDGPADVGSAYTTQTSRSRPEGWWSSDDVAGTDREPSTPPSAHSKAARLSPDVAYQSSVTGTDRDKEGGTPTRASFGSSSINLPKATAVGGITSETVRGGVPSSGSSGGEARRKKRLKKSSLS